LRCRVQAPIDVTVLRAGVADAVPGRVVDLGAGGVAAVLARELQPGESVGIEMQLPDGSRRLRTRAVVRHHDKLRCGMEFVGLSAEQRAAIRRFTKRAKSPGKFGEGALPDEPVPAAQGGGSQGNGSEAGATGGLESQPTEELSPAPAKPRGRGWIFLLASVVILLAVLRWRWDRGWDDLEAGLRPADQTPVESVQPEARVSAEVMQKLVTHRVDPEYPEAARAGNLQGVVIADVVIGANGAVVSVRPVNGPEIFMQPAADALRWWRFEPYRMDGRAVPVETTVAVEFKP
jgi:TonB family protein